MPQSRMEDLVIEGVKQEGEVRLDEHAVQRAENPRHKRPER